MRSGIAAACLGAWLELAAAGSTAAPPPALVDGDVVFQTSRSAQSAAVQKATRSRYSHMGVVLRRDGRDFVLEAARTVRYTPLETWLARGEGGHYVAKRSRTPLSGAQVERLRRAAKAFEGKPYDPAFEWSDRRLYCSELVWKLFDRALGVQIGERAELGDFALDDPLVRTKLHERYGKAVPLHETVISPQAMFASPLLETVAED